MLVELHVFTETLRPDPPPIVATVRPLTVLPHLMPRFDRIINVVGNSHYHLRTFEFLLRHGGACIAHDARMLSFYVGLLGPDRASRVAACELGRPVAVAELEAWLANESELEALFLGEILEAAAPTIVHSRTTARMATERYPTPPVHVPFAIYRTPPDAAFSPDARRAARRRLGIADGEVAIVSLGFVTYTKAPAECIHAIEMLRHWGIPATLYFAGDRVNLPDGGAALIALATSLGISNAVRFADGFIAEAAYQDYLIGCDLALQLRTSGFGSVSGAVLDCVAAGLPVVTTAGLAEAVEVPAGLTRAVSDHLSPVLIAEAAAELLTATRDEEARRAFCEARSMTAYAALLCDALGLSVTRGAPPPSSRGCDVHRH
jgi:glycosyltransferase involved in cell wall biosynthesis